MNSNFTQLAVFEYSTEAQVLKAKLQAEGIKAILVDALTVDADPLINQAIGGVKLKVHNNDFIRANHIYNEFRSYEKDEDGNALVCPVCKATRVLIAPLKRQNIFYKLFPFFEKTRHICNECKNIF